MDVNTTFRHMDATESLKSYAKDKLSRLEKHFMQPTTAKVTLSIEKQEHVAEVQLSSGKQHVEAKAVGEEMYACLDAVVDKLERQISASKGEKVAKNRRSGESLKTSLPDLAEKADRK